jgi:hypothetical protein
MFVIDKAGLRNKEINGENVTDYREIAKIMSKNPKYIDENGNNLSIYLIPDNFKGASLSYDDKDEENENLNLLGQAKMNSGRGGRKIRKKDLNILGIALRNGGMPEEDIIDFLDFSGHNYGKLGENRKNEMKKVYSAANSLKKIKGKTSLEFIDLDYDGEEGQLIQLPITNFTTEQIDKVKNGMTSFLIIRKDQGKLKKITILGDKVESLDEYGYNNEPVITNIEQLIDPKGPLGNSAFSENDVKSKLETEDGLEKYGDLGFNEYKPTGEEMVEITYIYGPNRSGKTYYAAKYATLWSNMFKDWPIFLFSRRDKDKVLDDIPQVNRIMIDESLLTNPLNMTDFQKSLVIFDDIDTIADKKICRAVQKLRDDIMETGRQKMIYVINTSHLGMNWTPTRTVLNEANSYTLFPRKGNHEHNCKILKNKMGMKMDVIKGILEKPNGLAYKGKWGWITVYKDSPQYLIYENGVRLL